MIATRPAYVDRVGPDRVGSHRIAPHCVGTHCVGEEFIAPILAPFGPRVTTREWRIGRGRRRIEIRMEGRWLVFEWSCSARGRPAPVTWLHRQADHSPFVKFVWRADGTVRARAEIPIDDSTTKERAATAAWIGEVLPHIGEKNGDGAVSPAPNADSAPSRGTDDDWSDWLGDRSCWQVTASSNRRARVALEGSRGAVYSAVLVRHPVPRVSVDLTRFPMRHDRTGLAVAAFLLEAAGAIRLVRAYARNDDADPSVGFEVCLPAEHSSRAAAHALSALSVAAEGAGAEVTLLAEDPDLAHEYLTVRHPSLLRRARTASRPMASRRKPTVHSHRS